MSGPRVSIPACRGFIERHRDVKRTIRSGRYNAWISYRTPGVPFTASGFEPNARTVIAERGRWLSSISIYLRSNAPQARWIQIFDCPTTSAVVNGRTWEPEFIFQVNPGQTIEFEPPKERAFYAPTRPGAETMYENDAGYPFDHGILVVESTFDTGIDQQGGQVPPPSDEIRITARMLDPFSACL